MSFNKVVARQPTTIFTVMSALAAEHGAINLGQGFPDGEGPEVLRNAAAKYILEGPNQYPPMQGMPRLRQAVAEHDQRFYGLDIDWEREVLVTSGATEALTSTFIALIEPGDEAVLIEPVYDSYRPVIEAMGGCVKTVPLDARDWSLSHEELEAAFSNNTKLIVVNSPMNPTGKVFEVRDLLKIAQLAQEYDAYVVCDEVYEHLVFDGAEHVPILTLPDMRDRTVRIASAGKTFSLTGWKVGYITATTALCDVIGKAHQFVTFTTPPALQLAVADGLALPRDYFDGLAAGMRRGKEILAQGLHDIGFDVRDSSGTYFITAAIDAVAQGRKDADFCQFLTREAGVTAIPVSAFFGDVTRAPTNLIRFCFCKEEAVLVAAVERLKRL